jgi:hypothetical protein
VDPKPLPTSKQEAFVDSKLYAHFSLEGREEEELIKFFYGGGTLDAWCPTCKQPSVFTISNQLSGYGEQQKKSLPYSGVIQISAFCGRGVEGSYSSGCRSPLHIIFVKDYNDVRKIGQHPSAADLAFGSLDEAFNKELDPSNRRELGTAIGLHAHGVGIGSFVYLRRIFESLLEEAHLQAKADDAWDDAQYDRSRIPERIRLLHKHLPPRLVSAASLYKLLSVGIHELSEEECLDAFAFVKGAIELILKERHEDKRYDEVIKAVNAKNPPS